ncbi:helix-turn-helix transcriptional regulator [Citricoccus sp. GCM10030269]|uniref:helix-turn-helix transcriptional regulator n=1 Tax=Citricoccus sp. GCM10030269 TaxID=3273388 RepID=UPI003617CE56
MKADNMTSSLADSESSPVYTPQQFASREHIPLATVYKWRTEGKGPRGYRVGKHLRFLLADIQAWEQEQLAKESA